MAYLTEYRMYVVNDNSEYWLIFPVVFLFLNQLPHASVEKQILIAHGSLNIWHSLCAGVKDQEQIFLLQ